MSTAQRQAEVFTAPRRHGLSTRQRRAEAFRRRMEWDLGGRPYGRERLPDVGLRWMTAGESHGPALVAVLEGVPAGVAVTTADLDRDLARRRLGYGRGARMSFERDEVEILGGVRHGRTLGAPVAIEVANTEWPKWEQVMSADPVEPGVLDDLARNAPLT